MRLNISLIDEESELIIGKCLSIRGMTGEYEYVKDDEAHYKIILENLLLSDEFKKYLIKNKSFLGNIRIAINNRFNTEIGYYHFCITNPIRYRKEIFDLTNSLFEIDGIALQKVSREALIIWKEWTEELPLKKNIWGKLSKKEQIGWLEVARVHCTYPIAEREDDTFYIDGTFIKDRYSFFCALGEAINGAGGYYGFNNMSLVDCLCGGFGAVHPFNLVWEYSVSEVQYTDVQAKCEEIDFKTFSKKVLASIENKQFIIEAIEELSSRNVTISFILTGCKNC